MTPALARLLVEDRARPADERPKRRATGKKRAAAQVKVPQQRTGVRLPPR